MIEPLTIDPSRFNNTDLIESRAAEAPDALRAALTYLYLDDGPFSLPDETRKAAEPFLDRAEKILIGWLAGMCVAKVFDARISVCEQHLRGGCRTDRAASDDAIGPEKRPPVLPKPARGTGTSPIADLDPQSINDRDHSQRERWRNRQSPR